jgi:hypothetical protein
VWEGSMTRIPDEDRYLMEQFIYLPMVLTVLNRDMNAIQHSQIKLKQPYLLMIEEAMKKIQKELSEIKKEMKKRQLKVVKIEQDEAFTMYSFLYKGYEEHHNYFNPRIRNKVQELIIHYFINKERTSAQ